MPTEPEKGEGPTTELVSLGMELDSRQLVILERWRAMKSCKKRNLLSIIGVLSHASTAIRAGRSFLRRLIDLSTGVRQLHRHIRLNREARVDLEWWHQFGEDWNSVAMMWCMDRAKPGTVVTTDVSGAWGCGAWWESQWLQLRWDGLGETARYGVTAKEMLPIVVDMAVWGKAWQGQSVLARCDNMAVVAIENPSCHSRGGAAGASYGEASRRESQLDKAVAELFQKCIALATQNQLE